MDSLTLQLTAFDAVRMLWAMAFGACVGSLINVLAYRIPRGLDFVTPQSRCPSCSTKLTWRENIPIFGWLLLGGRCRFCRSPISAEYPIVETIVAVLWGAAYMACYSDPSTPLHGLFSWAEPEWARSGFVQTWPIFLVIVTLLSSLVAMTLVDARTFTIPPVLTNVPTVVALLVHPIYAVIVQMKDGRLIATAPGYSWSIWTPDKFGWWWVGAGVGGAVGFVVANLLLRFGVLKRSFEDYAAWEAKTLAEIEAKQGAAGAAGAGEAATARVGPAAGLSDQADAQGADAASVAASASDDRVNGEQAVPPTEQEMWVQYPHARREMARELLFVGVIAAFAVGAAYLALRLAGPWAMNVNTLRLEPTSDVVVPLWLQVTSGAFLGYLIGGGVVWAIRILGTLAFGKEALGLGDVHMMAAVGACLGWIDPTLAFFGAAFLGMAGWAIQYFSSGENKRMLPYGPFLAMATIVVWFGKPVIERAAGWALGGPVNWP